MLSTRIVYNFLPPLIMQDPRFNAFIRYRVEMYIATQKSPALRHQRHLQEGSHAGAWEPELNLVYYFLQKKAGAEHRLIDESLTHWKMAID